MFKSLLQWLFGPKNRHETTLEYKTWKRNALHIRALISKAGNKPTKESEAQLLVRYYRESERRSSPFIGDNNCTKIRKFALENGIPLVNKTQDPYMKGGNND